MKNIFKYDRLRCFNKRMRLLKFNHCLFSIFVKTQPTPNPHFLKFLPGKEILEEGETFDFSNVNEALPSPLARKLFDVFIMCFYV